MRSAPLPPIATAVSVYTERCAPVVSLASLLERREFGRIALLVLDYGN